jgi:signal transduction histidine kinase
LRRRVHPLDAAWVAFAVANAAAMVRWEAWETVPFHFIWVSLTLLYGLRVWRREATGAVLAAVAAVTGTLILIDIHHSTQEWSELTEVPLMTAMFVAMVWHARRRQVALVAVERLADERASLLERQERFLHDASHELRTPVTVARGHLEMLDARDGPPEVRVALDELGRMERLINGLLLLAKGDQPDFVVPCEIDVEPFLEDVFMRWSEVADRAWRLGPVPAGTLRADAEALRTALDALLDNAVKHTESPAAIELRARTRGRSLEIEVTDAGPGIPEEALGRIFDRFGRADPARGRDGGGVGLGLAIVDAIAKAHHGRCTVRTSHAGTTFCLVLPGFVRARAGVPARAELANY